MGTEYEVIVVGAGMMGSAAARHLTRMGRKVALIGPGEPVAPGNHTGVFASHYDAARITRALDANADWSRLAIESMDRYADIAAEGQRTFHHPVGVLMAGPERGPRSSFIDDNMRVALRNRVAFEALSGPELAVRFPYFDFPEGIIAMHEARGAGHINPRELVAAQMAAAAAGGADLYPTEALRIEETASGAVVHCADGAQYGAQKVIVACGAFCNADGLLPEPLPLTVYARTIAFFELPEAEATRLKQMPSVLYRPLEDGIEPYILPPVRYPDGRHYIKIGGDPVDVVLETVQDMKDWFRSGGNRDVGDAQADVLLRLMPGLGHTALTYGACVTSFSPSGKPLIFNQTDRITALAAGCGAAAKSSDEIGRLGALAACGEPLPADLYESDFR